MPCLRPGKESGSVPGLKCCLFCTSIPNSLQTVLGWDIQIQDLAYLASNFSPCLNCEAERMCSCSGITLSSTQLGWSSRKILILISNWRQILPAGAACWDMKFHPLYHYFISSLSESRDCSVRDREALKNLQMWRWGCRSEGRGERSALCLYT